jgi:hypothetical protein
MGHALLLLWTTWLACSTVVLSAASRSNADDRDIKRACPDYKQYSTFRQYVLRHNGML